MVKNIKVGFTAQDLSSVSGIYPILVFLKKIGLNQLLKNFIPAREYCNQKFSFGQIITGIVCALMAGYNRIKKVETFTEDPLFREALGLKGPIKDSTIISRIENVGMKESYAMNELNGKISRKIHAKFLVKREIVDCDSTVKTVYGSQEGAAVGYNPYKKGAKSYHPLLAFLNSTKECILSYFRPGDAYTANNAAEFVRHIYGIMYKSWKSLVFRMDSGFYDGAIFDAIEEIKGVLFLVKAKIRNQTSFLENRNWIEVVDKIGWEQTEFEYQAHGWKHARRFIAVRKLIRIETEGMVFPKAIYEYFCYCTNMRLKPWQGHEFYGDRGTCENWIEAVKKQMFAGMLLTHDFWVNDFLWSCSVLAYNVGIWMRYLVDRKSHHEEPETFRSWFIRVAGKVIRRSHQVKLVLSRNFLDKDRWQKFYCCLCELRI
jgi:hypothetical protein